MTAPPTTRHAWRRTWRTASVTLLAALLLALGLTTLDSATPASASTTASVTPHAVLPVGAIKAGTGATPDVKQIRCYVGDSYWDMKINGTWYCWASNGEWDIFPDYYDTTAIYTHNNSGWIWSYYSSAGGSLFDRHLIDWSKYYVHYYITGFKITGR